jgi:hypothetical protein
MPQRSVFARSLHHMYGLAPDVIVFGGPWLDRSRLILRHKDAPTSKSCGPAAKWVQE